MTDASDRLDVMWLIARIAHLADSGTPDEYLECFTLDAVWELTDATGLPMLTQLLTGRQALRLGVLERRAAGIQGPGTHTMHDVSAIEVAVDSDTATARTYFRYYRNTHEVPHLAGMGWYDDVFLRRHALWLLDRRVICRG